MVKYICIKKVVNLLANFHFKYYCWITKFTCPASIKLLSPESCFRTFGFTSPQITRAVSFDLRNLLRMKHSRLELSKKNFFP